MIEDRATALVEGRDRTGGKNSMPGLSIVHQSSPERVDGIGPLEQSPLLSFIRLVF